jgi:hypothetical protein
MTPSERPYFTTSPITRPFRIVAPHHHRLTAAAYGQGMQSNAGR